MVSAAEVGRKVQVLPQAQDDGGALLRMTVGAAQDAAGWRLRTAMGAAEDRRWIEPEDRRRIEAVGGDGFDCSRDEEGITIRRRKSSTLYKALSLKWTP